MNCRLNKAGLYVPVKSSGSQVVSYCEILPIARYYTFSWGWHLRTLSWYHNCRSFTLAATQGKTRAGHDEICSGCCLRACELNSMLPSIDREAIASPTGYEAPCTRQILRNTRTSSGRDEGGLCLALWNTGALLFLFCFCCPGGIRSNSLRLASALSVGAVRVASCYSEYQALTQLVH